VVPMNKWPEPELRQSLRQVSAPCELWDRIQTQAAAPPPATNRLLVWALAAAVVLMAFGLSLIHRDNVVFPVFAGGRCQNPAQIRAWVRAKTGLDLPLRSDPSQSLELTAAQTIDGTRGVKIAYRAGNHDAVLLLSTADGSTSVPHSRFGPAFALGSENPADLQLACKLCHLD
jgi:hypothetical protein